jgi:hypothetical protein
VAHGADRRWLSVWRPVGIDLIIREHRDLAVLDISF